MDKGEALKRCRVSLSHRRSRSPASECRANTRGSSILLTGREYGQLLHRIEGTLNWAFTICAFSKLIRPADETDEPHTMSMVRKSITLGAKPTTQPRAEVGRKYRVDAVA